MILSFDDLGPTLKKEDILARVSAEAIYKKWCPKFPAKIMKSPFRKETHPSFGFYQKDKEWRWKDLGNGDGGSVFDFVSKCENTDFKGALRKIAEAFYITAEDSNQIIIGGKFNSSAVDKANERKRSLIQVIRRDIRQSEYTWWNRILWTPTMMEAYYVRAAKEVWVDKKLYWFDKATNPIYYFLSPLSGNIKTYRPLELDKKRKWLSNQDPGRDIQGYHQCQIKAYPGRPLLLTTALKEVGFFRAFGINAMANTAEHTYFNPDFIRHIKKYCYPIIYLGDNDWPGMRACVNIWQRYAIHTAIINRKWGAKDAPDLWLANYRKVYDLLNLLYDYFQNIRVAGIGAAAPRELRGA